MQHVISGQRLLTECNLAFLVLLHQLVELGFAVIAVVAPLTQTRQRGNRIQMAANLLCLVVEVDGITAFHQHAGSFGAGWAGTDHQDCILRCSLTELLRMPAATVFFAGGRILGTDHWRAADFPTRDTDVTTDTDADIVVTAFFDFLRQERIGDGRTCATDDVGKALGHDLGHFFRISVAAYAQHRLLRYLLDELGPGHLMALLVEARWACILTPFGDVADVHVPQVEQGVSQFDELHAVDFNLDLIRAVNGIHSETGRNRTLAANRMFDLLQRFEPETCTVFQRTAVFVGALVIVRIEEL